LLKIGGQADHGFDEPLGLLSDCHRRIEFFLDLLLRVSREARGRELTDEERRALERALAYFATAAPRHTADEEETLFPVLRRCGRPEAAEVMSVVERLEGDHRRADAGHAVVDRLATRWMSENLLSDEDSKELIGTLESLRRTYEGHIAIEDNEVFPAASRLLSSAELAHVGREMADRRGVKHP
jgi:hemerythrin-like domain-containing protein